jgi:CrcB protein
MIWMVLFGGALGAAARYGVAAWMADALGTRFPWGTLTVNVVGSFLIGLVAVLADEHGSIGPYARTFLIVGVLGGFTTFSSFSAETLRLWEHEEFARFSFNVLGNVALCLAAVALGTAIARTWAAHG